RRAAPHGGPPTPARRARWSCLEASHRSARRRRRASSSVARVPLLAPWVPVHVVTVRLPEACFVVVHQLEATDPLGALPEVEVRDEQPRGAAVLRRQRLAVVAERDPRLAVADVLER